MKFDPRTSRLFTDDGRLIKQLYCPFVVDWEKLQPGGDPTARRCTICQHSVTDTANFTDEDLLQLMAKNPKACLKIDFDQSNLTLTGSPPVCK